MDKKKFFLGMGFSNLRKEELINNLKNRIAKRKKTLIFTPNIDHIVLCEKDVVFRNIYLRSNYAILDSSPIFLLSKIFNVGFKQRITGAEMVPALCELANKENYRIFFLGDSKITLSAVKDKMKIKYSGAICKYYSPEFGFDNDLEIIKKINSFKPDIVFVAFGTPKQEKWIFNNRKRAKAIVFIGIGNSFKFFSGLLRRAPKAVQAVGFEWFYRLLQEPRKLFPRYFWRDLRFIIIFFREIFIYLKRAVF